MRYKYNKILLNSSSFFDKNMLFVELNTLPLKKACYFIGILDEFN